MHYQPQPQFLAPGKKQHYVPPRAHAPPGAQFAAAAGRKPPPLTTSTPGKAKSSPAVSNKASAAGYAKAPHAKTPAAIAAKASSLAAASLSAGKHLKSPPPNINPNVGKAAAAAMAAAHSKSTATTPASKPNYSKATTATSTSSKQNSKMASTTPKATPKPKDIKSNKNKSNPLLDPAVVPAVHSIISLLQTYGPLSYEQLKFNMVPQLVPVEVAANNAMGMTRFPPLKVGQAPPVIPSPTQVVGIGEKTTKRTRDRLLKVLDILHELGVIHLVDKSKLKSKGKKAKPAAAGAAAAEKGGAADMAGSNEEPPSQAGAAAAMATKQPPPPEENQADDPNPIYCFGNGIPRMDVVLPSTVLSEIKKAGEEVLRTKHRIEILRKALLAGGKGDGKTEEKTLQGVDKAADGDKAAAKKTATPAATPASAAIKDPPKKGRPPKRKRKSQQQPNTPFQRARAVLEQLYALHPDEISRDPVYAAALKMFRADVSKQTRKAIAEKHGMKVENSKEMEVLIAAGVNFGKYSSGSGGGKEGTNAGGTLGKSKKRASGSKESLAGEGVKKKRKKGRPPKNSTGNSSSSEKLKQQQQPSAGAGDVVTPVVRANASWI